MSGAVAIGAATVNTELPLPNTDTARLTVYSQPAQLLRPIASAACCAPPSAGRAKPTSRSSSPSPSDPASNARSSFAPTDFSALVARPSRPVVAVHDGRSPTSTTCDWSSSSSTGRSTRHHQRFGVRTITQGRDDDERFPELGKGGSFYLQVNGRDFLVRGATYTPDLLYALRPRPRRRDPRLRPRPRAEHAAAGVEDPRRALRRAGRRTRHPAHGRLDVLQPVGEVAAVGRRGQPRRPGQPALTDRRCCARTPRRSSGPTPATAGRRDQVCERLPPDPARPALAERRRRHRVVLRHRRGGRTRLGRHPDGGPVHLATAVVLVQRPLPRGARRVGRAGRQRTHSAVRQPDRSSSRPTSCGRSTTTGTSTPVPTRATPR